MSPSQVSILTLRKTCHSSDPPMSLSTTPWMTCRYPHLRTCLSSLSTTLCDPSLKPLLHHPALRMGRSRSPSTTFQYGQIWILFIHQCRRYLSSSATDWSTPHVLGLISKTPLDEPSSLGQPLLLSTCQGEGRTLTYPYSCLKQSKTTPGPPAYNG